MHPTCAGKLWIVHVFIACGIMASFACDKATPSREASSQRDRPHAGAPVLAIRDVARESGVTFSHDRGAHGDYLFPELIGAGGAFLDYDGDGDLDIYLIEGGDVEGEHDGRRNVLYRNDDGAFVDVSKASGADVPGYGMGCAAADVDNDGDVDLFVTRLGPNVLLRNNGDGTFSDATRDAGVGDPSFGVSCAFFDYDRDGLLDLYVVNYVEWSRAIEHTCYSPEGLRDYCGPLEFPPAADKLYHNLGDGRFEDVSESSGIGKVVRDGLGIICEDFDLDGWVDIYVANDQTPAFCWINKGDGTFEEDAALRGCAVNAQGVAIAGMGVAADDVDGNGFADLLITNIAMQTHLLLLNTDGLFEDKTRRYGLAGWNMLQTGFGVAWVDFENDGVRELFVGNGAVGQTVGAVDSKRPYAQLNQIARRSGAQGRFEKLDVSGVPAMQSVAVTRGVIPGDYDNDGDVDLLVTNNGAAPQLLRNDAKNDNAWITLIVHDEALKRDAINARVTVVAGGRTYRKTVRAQSGYLGSCDPRLHFGLGGATSIDRVSVVWPDGVAQDFHGLALNQQHVLRKNKQ